MARRALNPIFWLASLTAFFLFTLGASSGLLASFPSTTIAQSDGLPVQARWSQENVPSEGWTIGDRIPLRLAVTYPADGSVTIPELPENWGQFEVREQGPSQVLDDGDGAASAVYEATVTLWKPGEHRTPQFSVQFRDSTDKLHEIIVPPLSISVTSVLKDGETDKRDLKPQASLSSPPVWPWALCTALLLTSGAMVGWRLNAWQRRRRASVSSPGHPADLRSAHDVAYLELERIAALNLPARGDFKYHYTQVADCVRNYICARYGIRAMDHTTEELTTSLHELNVNRNHNALFYQLLAEADLVKFSEFQPSMEQASAFIDQARRAVDLTRIEESTDGWTGDMVDGTRLPLPLSPESTPRPSNHDT